VHSLHGTKGSLDDAPREWVLASPSKIWRQTFTELGMKIIAYDLEPGVTKETFHVCETTAPNCGACRRLASSGRIRCLPMCLALSSFRVGQR
jgi:hypothetical protein